MLLSNNESIFITSLDCATRELFRKIKGVDKFDVVIENIKKYVIESKSASNNIVVKYIILEGVNDSKEEIDKWIELCSNLGITKFFVSIEFCHSTKNKKEISQHICDLYCYAKDNIKKFNPNFEVLTYEHVELFIKNHSYRTN